MVPMSAPMTDAAAPIAMRSPTDGPFEVFVVVLISTSFLVIREAQVRCTCKGARQKVLAF